MLALTLIQPWATLKVLDEKYYETRSWETKFRGKLAIHAGAKIDFEACEIPEIKAALARHGYTDPKTLPTSAILSTCVVFDCVQMVGSAFSGRTIVPGYKLSTKEEAFGDYRPGRYAWILADNKRLKKPVPAKGKLKLWEWKEDDRN
jgi:hypothetical protein